MAFSVPELCRMRGIGQTMPFPFVAMGEFRLGKDAAAEVRITNKDADGFIVVDGVRFWMGE